MGQILNVLAYVTGLQRDGADIQQDYVLKKRHYLSVRAQALASFGNILIDKQMWRSSYPVQQCVVETVVETDLDTRPKLKNIAERKEKGRGKGEEFSIIVVDQRDLCRDHPETEEEYVFEDIMHPYLSVIFAAGFSHELRLSPIIRGKTSIANRKVYCDGDKILEKIYNNVKNISSNHVDVDVDEVTALQGELLAHTSDANNMLKKTVDRLVQARKNS